MVKEVVMMPYLPHAHGARLTLALRVGILATLCAVPLSACGMLDAWQSADTDTAPSIPAEKVMSGEYEVGPDGKLLNPNRDERIERPQIPMTISRDDAAAAEDFARYFVDLIHYTWLTNDTQRMREYTDPKCELCQEVIKTSEEALQNQGWTIGGEMKLEDLTEAFEIPNHPNLWHKEFKHTQAPLTFYDGKTLFKNPETVSVLIIQMHHDPKHGWRVTSARGEKYEN